MNILPTTIIEFDLTERVFKEIPWEQFVIDPENDNKIYWIYFDLNQKQHFASIAATLHLPDYVIQDCYDEDKSPKLYDDEMSVTIQTQCLLATELKNDEEVESESLILHLTPRYCFTASTVAIPALLLFIKSCSKALPYAQTSCFILFMLMDNIINDYSKMMLDFELISDQSDLRVREMDDDIYNEVVNLKKQLMKTKRYISAIRDILMRITSRKMPVISQECRRSLRNLFNHSQMIFVQVDSIRDILNSTLEQIDNFLMQKMNRTMKVLTAFAAIFLPLSLIAGIYGMNFHNIPELHWKYGYLWALLLMLCCGGTLIYIFIKKKWF